MKIKKYVSGTGWVQQYPEVNISSIVATGTPTSSTFLRGDGQWAVPNGVDNYVNITGDTMTGNLDIQNGAPTIKLLDTSGTDGYYLHANNGNFYILQDSTSDGTYDSIPFMMNDSGNVGIGTSNPIEKLSVFGQDASFYSGTATQNFYIGRNGNERIRFLVDDSSGFLTYQQDENVGNHSFYFDIDSPTTGIKAFIFNKNIGIGTSTPTQALDVVGNIAVSGTVDGVDIAALSSTVDGKASLVGASFTGDVTITNADPQLTLSDNTAGSPTGDDFSLFVNGGEFNITTDNTGVAQPLELRNLSEKGYLYGDEISVVGHTHTLANITDSGAAAAKGVVDSASPTAMGTGTDLPTERDVYYGLVAVNGASQTRATTIYAPTSAGTSGQVLTSTGGTPSWGSIPGQLEEIMSTATTATFTGSATVVTVNLDSGKSVSTTETILMEVDIVNPSTSSAYEKAYVMMRLGSNQSSTNTPMASWSTLDSSASGNPRLWSMLIRYNTSTSLQLRYGGYMLSTNLNSKTYGTVYVQRIWKVTV